MTESKRGERGRGFQEVFINIGEFKSNSHVDGLISGCKQTLQRQGYNGKKKIPSIAM